MSPWVGSISLRMRVGVAVALVDRVTVPLRHQPHSSTRRWWSADNASASWLKQLLDFADALLISVLRLGEGLLQPLVDLGLSGGGTGGELGQVAQGGALLLAVVDLFGSRQEGSASSGVVGWSISSGMRGFSGGVQRATTVRE